MSSAFQSIPNLNSARKIFKLETLMAHHYSFQLRYIKSMFMQAVKHQFYDWEWNLRAHRWLKFVLFVCPKVWTAIQKQTEVIIFVIVWLTNLHLSSFNNINIVAYYWRNELTSQQVVGYIACKRASIKRLSCG